MMNDGVRKKPFTCIYGNVNTSVILGERVRARGTTIIMRIMSFFIRYGRKYLMSKYDFLLYHI